MRQSPEGTGDTALQIPSWRPEEEGGSQDVRAIFPLTWSPVSLLLALAWPCWGWGEHSHAGDTLLHPGWELSERRPVLERTPGFSSPVGRGSSKDQVPGEHRGGGDGDPVHREVQHWGLACWLRRAGAGGMHCVCPPEPQSPALPKSPGDGWHSGSPLIGTGWKSGQGLSPPLRRGLWILLSAGSGVRVLTTFRGIFLHWMRCNGEESGQVSGQSPVAPSAPFLRFARALERFVSLCSADIMG